MSKVTVPAVLIIAMVAGGSSFAGEAEWKFRFEAIQMEVFGHDPHVLTIHRIDSDATPPVEDQEAVSLDTESGTAYRTECQYTRGQWGVGIDVLMFLTSQDAASLSAAAEGPSGAVDVIDFEVASNSFSSTDPGEVLFYDVLEDTDLESWTVDVYGRRELGASGESGLHLVFGLRLGDFDNDYRAVVGLQGIGGTRMDASSNYGLMMGPLIGLSGSIQHGRNRIDGYIGQSLILGDAGLSSRAREFTGTFGTTPVFLSDEVFRRDEDVAIPISDLRLKWSYRVSRRISLGLGVNTTAWWDVPVPPGVMPTGDEEGLTVLHENTLVFFGLAGSVELRF